MLGVAAAALIAGAVPISAGASTGHDSGPKRGGTLTFADLSLATTLDPAINYINAESQAVSMEAVYGDLAHLNPKTGSVELGFLQSLKPSNGNRVWTMVLPKGLKFSDGSAFNAAAIAFNIHRGADPKTGDLYQPELAAMTTKVVNATTLRVTLQTPDTGFPAEMSQEFEWIASPKAVAAEGTSYSTNPVGAGPFKVQSWTQGASMTLVRNSYYKLFAPGQPYLDSVVVEGLASSFSQAVAALSSKTAQMAWGSGATLLHQMQSTGATVLQFAGGGGNWLTFNTAVPPFNNPIARQAVSLALNHQDLASAWAAGSTAQSNLFAKTSPFYSPKSNVVSTDTAKARQLFAQLQASGVSMKFSVVLPTTFTQLAAYLQSNLDQYPGVSVDPQLVVSSVYSQDINTGNFQLTGTGASFTNPVPTLQWTLEPGGPLNLGKWNDPAVGAAIAKLSKTNNLTTQKKEWAIVADEVNKGFPIYTAQATDLGLAYLRDSIGGVKPIEYGTLPLFGPLYIR